MDFVYHTPLIWLSGFALQPKAVRLYELSVDCYRNLQSWLEASKVMLDLLAIGTEAILPAVGVWSKVRKDAIVSGDQLFTEM